MSPTILRRPHCSDNTPSHKACVVPRPIGWISTRNPKTGVDNLAPYVERTPHSRKQKQMKENTKAKPNHGAQHRIFPPNRLSKLLPIQQPHLRPSLRNVLRQPRPPRRTQVSPSLPTTKNPTNTKKNPTMILSLSPNLPLSINLTTPHQKHRNQRRNLRRLLLEHRNLGPALSSKPHRLLQSRQPRRIRLRQPRQIPGLPRRLPDGSRQPYSLRVRIPHHPALAWQSPNGQRGRCDWQGRGDSH